MKQLLLILPGLLATDESGSLFDRDGWSALRAGMPTRAERISPYDRAYDVNPALVGLPPTEHNLAPGPLWVAGNGAGPPLSSVCFRWTLGCRDEEGVLQASSPPSSEEEEWIWQQLERLSGPRWTPLRGAGLDHCLVWEKGSLDLLCRDWPEVLGKLMSENFPQGDAEAALRQRVEDSLELLSDSDFNKRRRDQGLVEINVAWPWGPGFRQALPNLMLRMGKPLQLTGNDWGWKGLAALTRSKYADTGSFWRANLEFDPVGAEILWTNAFWEARTAGRLEAIERRWSEIQAAIRRFASAKDSIRRQVSVLAPNANAPGLALHWDSFVSVGDGVPLHERVFSDSLVRSRPLWEIVGNLLGSS